MSVGGPRFDPENVDLRLTQARPQQQYFTYNGETFMVQAIRRSATKTDFDEEDITHLRDWTKVGRHAMEAAEAAFNRTLATTDSFAQVKTVHVPLTGGIVTSSTDDSATGVPVDIGKEIKYSRAVTDAPEQKIIMDTATRAHVESQIKLIGLEASQWKEPIHLSQRTAQTNSARPADSNTPTPPTITTPPSADTTAPIPLSPLTFTAPAAYVHNEKTALSDFLKSQQTGTASSPLNPAQLNQPASIAISAQLAQFNPAVTHNPEELHKGAARFIAKHLSDFANNATDCEEMFTTLKARYDAPTSTPAGLKAELRDGASSKTKIKDRDYSILENCLANKTAAELTPDEKLLVAKAFTNSIHKTLYTDCRTYPKVYFKAIQAFFSQEKVGSIFGFFGKEQINGKGLLIVEETPTGEYKTWKRWPDSDPIRPDRTAFLLYKPTESNGKFSGFSRTTGIDARNPLVEPRPQTGASTRPAYYTDRQDIETGGGGNCGAFALADARLQKDQIYYRSESDWKAALEQQRVTIRSSAMSFLFEQAHQFTTDRLFPQILSAIHDSRQEIATQQHQHDATLTALLDKSAGTLLQTEKEWLVQLYAIHANSEGKDLDKPFFLAHAMRAGEKIAIIQEHEIIFTAPPADEPIDVNDYLFIHYNGFDHFKSVNRNYTPTETAPALNDIVSYYNSENAYLFARHTFLNSLSNPSTVQASLVALKTADLHGYLALEEMVGTHLLNNAATGTGVSEFLIALKRATSMERGHLEKLAAVIEHEIATRQHLQSRADFLSKMIQIFEAQPPLAAEMKLWEYRAALKRLKKGDTAGYLAARECLKSIVDIDKVDQSTISTITDQWKQILTAFNITSHLADRSQMTLEGAQHLTTHIRENPLVKARGDFFHTLLIAPTFGTLSADTKHKLDQQLNNLIVHDPSGYLAYREFIEGNSTIRSKEDLVAHRTDVMEYILTSSQQEGTSARAEVFKAVIANKQANLIQALIVLQRSQPNDYLALETVLGKGPSSPEDLGTTLQRRAMPNPESILKAFADRMYSTEHLSRSQFLNALDQSVTRHELESCSMRLQQKDPLTYFILDELLEGDVTVDRLTTLRADQIKRAIAERPDLQARVHLIRTWEIALDAPSPDTKQAMTKAIETVKKEDKFSWVRLFQMSLESESSKMTEALISSEKEDIINNFINKSIKNESKDASELMRELSNPSSTNESILVKWRAVLRTSVHISLALGCLVYDKKNLPTTASDPQPSTAEKAGLGLALIQSSPSLLKNISPLELAEKLVTTHVDDSTGSLRLAEGPEATT